MAAVVVVLFIFLAILWIYFLWSRRKFYACALKIGGPAGLPILGIGHKLLNMRDVLYIFPYYAAQYKKKTSFSWLGPFPALYTTDPQTAETILNNPDCLNKSVIYDVMNEVIGEGILTSKSPTWNHHRKHLNPAFNHKVLLGSIPVFNTLSNGLCRKLEQNVGCGEINVKELVFEMGLKTSIATTLGMDFEEETNPKFLGYWEKIVALTSQRVVKPWLSNSFLFRITSMYKPFMEARTIVMEFVYKLVLDRIKLLEKDELNENNNKTETTNIGKPKRIFIDQAIHAHQTNELTFNDIVAEANLMVFAAFETTATTIFSMLMSMAMHPQYQDKVYEEILTFFPEEEFEVRYEDFKNFVYLDMCINETLRTAASIPLIARDTTKDFPLSKDIVIPKGTQIIIDIFNMHRDESIWGPNAHAFNPDNFLPENLVGHHRSSFIPFSKGQRNCIGWQYAGMMLKVVLVKVLRKYRFTTKFRYEDLRYVENLTLRYEIIPLLEVHKR